jgi:hypothetical protein
MGKLAAEYRAASSRPCQQLRIDLGAVPTEEVFDAGLE